MNTMNKVSVIMPCFNDGLYIKEAIESVLAQTYPFIELIIVDDGSTDILTQQVLSDIEKSGVTVLRTNHIGPAAARNRGISASTGHYILPLDSDDKIEPTYLEKAVSILQDNPAVGVVYCQAEFFGEKKGRWELPDYSLSGMLTDNIVFVTSVFYRQDWEQVGGFCEDLIYGLEDYDFWLSLLELGRKIYQIPEVLFRYRIKPVSRTTKLSNSDEKMRVSYQKIFDNHRDLYKQHYDIVIPALRNALLDQLSIRRKIESTIKFVHVIKRIPFVKKLFRWFMRKA